MWVFWTDVFLSVVIATILTAAFALAYRQKGPWVSLPIFFSVVMLATWAGGIWITPVGPKIYGVPWVPFVIVGVIFALLLAIARAEVPPPRTRPEAAEEAYQEVRSFLAFRQTLWLILFLLALVIFRHYVGTS